ncbi:MAG: hypothetical protein KMY53_02895 [Desulfarculus sp.]|nr:hypothetical protein [Pseudomonadota bacterium]MBV1737087.1 hypothetical protein [Desulfarculus sp.]
MGAADTLVCSVPRKELQEINLNQYVREHGYEVPGGRFSPSPWSLEHPDVDMLMQKIRERGIPLTEYAGVKPMYGIKTGLNAAFLIDTATKEKLVRDDPKSAEIIKPYLRGQDIKRWTPEWAGLWMIVLKSSGDHAWPWSGANESEAEVIFQNTYPAIYALLNEYRTKLIARQDQGLYWWELRSCEYYDSFENHKIIHTDISWRPQFAIAEHPYYLVNTAYLWPTEDFYLLGVVNSPLLWSYMWRNAIHGKDEALRLIYSFTQNLPIAAPTKDLRSQTERAVATLVGLNHEDKTASREVLDWLWHRHEIDKPGNGLAAFHNLNLDGFIAEVQKRLPKGAGSLSPKDITELKQVYGDYALPMQAHQAEIEKLEHMVSDLVNRAYGLTPEEVDLLWKTAPPRMPFGIPTGR